MIAWQFQRALDEADHLDPFQSRFRPGYGIETALVTLTDDVWREQDGGGGVIILTALDGSADFCTIYQVSFWAACGAWCQTIQTYSSLVSFSKDGPNWLG